jgi:hypothetical protein
MIKLFLPVAALAFALAGCAKSDGAGEQAQADNVEMPAEEALASAGPDAMPASDAAAMPGADASLSPAPEATASAAAEAATKAAEKKM